MIFRNGYLFHYLLTTNDSNLFLNIVEAVVPSFVSSMLLDENVSSDTLPLGITDLASNAMEHPDFEYGPNVTQKQVECIF